MPVKPLLLVQTHKVDEQDFEEDFVTSSSDDDSNDEQWFPNQSEAKRSKVQDEKSSARKEKFKPGM